LKERITKVFQKCEEKPDAIILKNPGESIVDLNFFYATGLEQGLFEGCIAVLRPDGDITIIVSSLELELAKKADANILTYSNREEFNIHLKNSIQDCKKIGINHSVLPLYDFKKLVKILPDTSFLNVSDAFNNVRQVKDASEIGNIREAVKIADRVMEKIPEILHEDMFEYELAAEINYLLQKNGADTPAFDTISSFGKNTALPHYTHGNSQLKASDFIICDFGACFKRYNSDMTRTFVFGDTSEKHSMMYSIVQNAQKIAFENIKPGIKAKEVHIAVDDFINTSEMKGRFIHSTGHSLGLGVHDGGVGFNSECGIILEEGMVLTVEPGVYVPGFGGVRIEDDILVTKDGCELLTKSNRELIQI